MAVAARIVTDVKRASMLFRRLPEAFQTSIAEATHDYGGLIARRLMLSAIEGDGRPITTDRLDAAQRIRARRRTQRTTEIIVPKSLSMLDSMESHYVALRPGRGITDWARRNFTGHRVSGLSRVFRTPTGRIAYRKGAKSALFVTRMPFIQEGISQVRNKLPNFLRSAIISSRRRLAR